MSFVSTSQRESRASRLMQSCARVWMLWKSNTTEWSVSTISLVKCHAQTNTTQRHDARHCLPHFRNDFLPRASAAFLMKIPFATEERHHLFSHLLDFENCCLLVERDTNFFDPLEFPTFPLHAAIRWRSCRRRTFLKQEVAL